jgi:hypothetical protein
LAASVATRMPARRSVSNSSGRELAEVKGKVGKSRGK